MKSSQHSLKLKLMIYFGAIFNLFVFSTSYLIFQDGKSHIFYEFEARGGDTLSLLANLTAPHIENENLPELVEILAGLDDANDYTSIEVYDQNGETIVQTGSGGFETFNLTIFKNKKLTKSHRLIGDSSQPSSEFLSSVENDAGDTIGFLRLIMDRSQLETILQSFFYKTVLAGVFASFLAMLSTFLTVNKALELLPSINKYLELISAGDFNLPQQAVRKDEMGQIANSIQIMAKKIHTAHRELSLLSEFPKLNPNPVLRIEPNGNILLANQAADNFFETDSLIGKNIQEISGDFEKIDFEKLSKSDDRIVVEHQRKDKIIQFTFCGLSNFGVTNAYTFDLTQLKEKDRQLVQSGKLAALGEMTSGIAHELNNPLHFINGFNQRLIKKYSKHQTLSFDDTREYLEKIDSNCKRMRKIINHFRDFSRQSDSEFEKTDINKVINDSLVLMEEQLRLKNINLKLDLYDGELLVLGSHNRLEQVLINLLSNARDALTDQDRAEVVILSKEEEENVVIEIADNGPGIPDTTVAKIFNPFFTTKDVGKGTGLGLSISHGIVEEHSGSIDCISTVGSGTTFRLTFKKFAKEDKDVVA